MERKKITENILEKNSNNSVKVSNSKSICRLRRINRKARFGKVS